MPLTTAFRADGSWKVLSPADAYPKGGAYRAGDDMLKRKVVRRLLAEMSTHKQNKDSNVYIYSHFGIVCASFSRLNVNFNNETRTKDQPLGDGSLEREAIGNMLCESAVTLIRALLEGGGCFSIESPSTSYLLLHPTVKSLRQVLGVRVVRFCQCMYWLKFPDKGPCEFGQKDPMLLTNALLDSLGKMCDHSHTHVHPKGGIKLAEGWRQRTELAGRYLRRLCEQWVSCS